MGGIRKMWDTVKSFLSKKGNKTHESSYYEPPTRRITTRRNNHTRGAFGKPRWVRG